MRKLADELGVGAMSLYHYVPNKDELLDGMVDIVFGEIELPADRRRLEDRDAPAGDLDPRGAQPSPLGRRPDGVARDAGAGEPPAPRRRARLPPRGRLLDRDDHPGLLRPGRLHLRLRAPGEEPSRSTTPKRARRSRRSRSGSSPSSRRNGSSPRSRRSSPTSPKSSSGTSPRSATTSRPRSSTASTSSSTRSSRGATLPEGRWVTRCSARREARV